MLKIITRQKKEWDTKQKREFVPRIHLQEAKRVLGSSLIKVITGPRRAGKSVFATLLLKGHRCAYFNFDELATTNIDTESLIPTMTEVYSSFDFIFFDEIQNLNGWQLLLNRLQREGFNLVVSGSNANLLSGEFATHLTGRYIKIEIYPFSFSEFITARGGENTAAPQELATTFLEIGGYPEVVLSSAVEPRDYIKSLISAVIGKDVVLRHRLRKSGELVGVADWVFSNVSKEMTLSRLTADTREFNLPSSIQTVKKYLEYLEEAYLIKMVGRYNHNYRERLRSPKKVYAIDNGVVTPFGFRTSPDHGRLLENMVHGELLKTGKIDNIYYYRTTQGNKEVDFVVRQDNKTTELIQASWDISDTKTRKRELAGLCSAANETHCDNATIVTWLQEEEIQVKSLPIHVVPFFKWAQHQSNKGQ